MIIIEGNSLEIFKRHIEDIYECRNKVILLTEKGFSPSECKMLQTLNKGDIYMNYSIKKETPCHKDFIIPYVILDKVGDEHGNTIFIAEQICYNIDVIINKED